MIRPAREDDVVALRAVDVAAGAPFAAIGMAAIADDPPPDDAVYRDAVRAGLAWVTEEDGAVVGLLVAAIVDGGGHVAQVSVRPEHRGRRLGAALLDQAAAWSPTPALTLTTFRDVPWNAPYYARLGFRILDPAEQGPELRAVRADERRRGLDRWPRVAMVRVSPPAPGSGRR